VQASTPYDVVIDSVVISAQRFNGKTFEIKNNVIEINIFEHMDLPYLTGSILISDSSGIIDGVNIKGSETVVVKIRVKGDPSAKTVTKTFVIDKVSNAKASGDSSQTIDLHITENHKYVNDFMSISKAYSGSPESVIQQIMYDNLKKRVLTPGMLGWIPQWGGSGQAQIKYIIPNISPIDGIDVIKHKMYNMNGLPFYVYSTLYDDNLVLTDLESIFLKDPGSKFNAYWYDQGRVRKHISSSIDDQAFEISGYSMFDNQDQRKISKEGKFNSQFMYADISYPITGDRSNYVDVKLSEVFDSLVKSGIIAYYQKDKTFDPDGEYSISDKHDNFRLADLDIKIPRFFCSETNNGINNIYEDTESGYKLRESSEMIRKLLVKDPINIQVPGWNFLGRERHKTIGNRILLEFLKNDPAVMDPNYSGSRHDRKRSGDYIIYAARHIIAPDNYKIALTCTKVGNYAT